MKSCLTSQDTSRGFPQGGVVRHVLPDLGLLYTVQTRCCVFPLSSHIILSRRPPPVHGNYRMNISGATILMVKFSVVAEQSFQSIVLPCALTADVDGQRSLMNCRVGDSRSPSTCWAPNEETRSATALLPRCLHFLPLPPPVFRERMAAFESPS